MCGHCPGKEAAHIPLWVLYCVDEKITQNSGLLYSETPVILHTFSANPHDTHYSTQNNKHLVLFECTLLYEHIISSDSLLVFEQTRQFKFNFFSLKYFLLLCLMQTQTTIARQQQSMCITFIKEMKQFGLDAFLIWSQFSFVSELTCHFSKAVISLKYLESQSHTNHLHLI